MRENAERLAKFVTFLSRESQQSTHNNKYSKILPQHDLDHSVFVFAFRKVVFCLDFVLHFLSYVGSRDLASHWPAVKSK